MQIILGHMYEDYDLKDVKFKTNDKIILNVSRFMFYVSNFIFFVLCFLFWFHVLCLSSCYLFHFHFGMKNKHKTWNPTMVGGGGNSPHRSSLFLLTQTQQQQGEHDQCTRGREGATSKGRRGGGVHCSFERKQDKDRWWWGLVFLAIPPYIT